MSSYLSTPYEMSVPQESVNVQLVGTVLNKLQNKYDTNKALIDQTLEKYKSLRGISDADNEYIAARVAQAESAVKNFAQTNGDLSRSSNRDSMMSAMRGVYEDPLVKNAVQQRVKLENYETEVARLKDKNDGRYSDVNYQYGLYKAGLQEYKEGKTKGLGSLNYSNNIDMSKTYLEKMEAVKKLKGDRVVEYFSEDGKTKYKKEIKGMTDSEIREYVGTLMTAEENEQLKINGWAKFGANEAEARGLYANYSDQKIAQIERDISSYEGKANNDNLPEAERKIYKDKVAKLEDSKNYWASAKSNIDSTPIDTIGQQLEKANFINGLSQLASAEWSTTSEANDVFYKDADLDLKRAKELRETREFEIKNGVKADGTLSYDDAIKVSSAVIPDDELGSQRQQESLQDRHNGYYDNIINTGRSIFTDPEVEKSDKDAFESELKARGLDKNFNVVGDNAKGLSIALIVQQAFDASRIGATYKDKASVIDFSAMQKNNIAKDLVEVERDSYKATFEKDPEKYVQFLKKSQSQLNPKFSIVSDVQGNSKSQELSTKIAEFAKVAGGWNNMTEYLKQNPDKIREFAKLTDAADKAYKGIDQFIGLGVSTILAPTALLQIGDIRDNNLIEDAKESTEKLLRDKNLSSFTDKNVINFTNEKINDSIIKGFDQTKITGKRFDAKKELTVRLSGKDEIEVIQYEGESKSKWNFGDRFESKITVSPGDASYNEMMKYIEAKEGETSGLNADRIGISVPSSRPVIIDKTKNENKAKNSAYEISRAVQGNPNLRPIFKEVGGDPTAYAWDDKIRNTLSVTLADYPKEQVQAFTEKYMGELENYVVTPYVLKRFGNKEWGIKIETAEGKTIMEGKSLGLKNLDKDTAWLLKYQPQTFITEFLIRELVEDKGQTKINTILDGRD